MEYKQVGLPKVLHDRFLKIQPILGYRTFSEFVVSKIRDALVLEEVRAENILDEKVEERMNETVVT